MAKRQSPLGAAQATAGRVVKPVPLTHRFGRMPTR
jgi:hypothetical protein